MRDVIRSLEWLGLAITDQAATRTFYDRLFGAPCTDGPLLRYPVGDTELRLYPPASAHGGGRHVHYACSTDAAGYRAYTDALAAMVPTEEHDLGVYKSTYAFDPDGHCIEFADREQAATEIISLFEIVLEVASLERSLAWYDRFDPTVMDRGTARRRLRLDMGPFELELWEPQRGLAGARPGVDVRIGVSVTSPMSVGTMTDPDGHQWICSRK